MNLQVWSSMAKRLTLEEMQRLAERKGGKCLSKEYKNAYTKLKWRCKKGHVWKTSPVGVKYKGTWCPKCVHAGIENVAKRRLKEARDVQRRMLKEGSSGGDNIYITPDGQIIPM
jgi:hypothetical protein